MKELLVLLNKRLCGQIIKSDNAKLSFKYNDDYLNSSNIGLSVSMRLSSEAYTHEIISPWLWGLLPDNPAVIQRWAAQFGVSASSAFDLLSTQVGLDCAGAVQFCKSSNIDSVSKSGSVAWLTTEELHKHLLNLKQDSSAWLGRAEVGQFSLAGAQEKTALRFDGKRWGIPSGSEPTTHILKPAVSGFNFQDLNENLCMSLARAIGLPTAETDLLKIEDSSFVVVKRYDRILADKKIERIHQEDLCQALSVHPANKYQADGGPSPLDIINLLTKTLPLKIAEEDKTRFIDALIFNWIIAGTDGHAKNYSLLLAENSIRMAPLYDVASFLPYDTSNGHKIKLAMRIGKEYRLQQIDKPDTWKKFASSISIDSKILFERIAELSNSISEIINIFYQLIELENDDEFEFLKKLINQIESRSNSCFELFS